jgi:hypothetical protein
LRLRRKPAGGGRQQRAAEQEYSSESFGFEEGSHHLSLLFAKLVANGFAGHFAFSALLRHSVLSQATQAAFTNRSF